VADHGGRVRLLEGYGLTETVTAVVAMPLEHYREGSIGIPFPDMVAKICRPGAEVELPPGEDGEICISGPAVMMGYLDDPDAIAEALRLHQDGRIWLHSGDVGHMDADGFFHFVCRLKRMIKTAGMNVFPTQVEAVLYQHPAVHEACVVGVPDPSLAERVRAVVVLRQGAEATDALKDDIMDHCRQRLIRWSCPREIVVRADMPRTLVGKIDLKTVTDEERRRS
jgi:long-chain acyl-CoA synthetase